MLAEVAGYALRAKRLGGRLQVDEAPVELKVLLEICGLTQAVGVQSAGQHVRQIELGEQ